MGTIAAWDEPSRQRRNRRLAGLRRQHDRRRMPGSARSGGPLPAVKRRKSAAKRQRQSHGRGLRGHQGQFRIDCGQHGQNRRRRQQYRRMPRRRT